MVSLMPSHVMHIPGSLHRIPCYALFIYAMTSLICVSSVHGSAAPGTDYNMKKHSNRAGGFVDVVLRLRSTSLVKMIAAGVKHERRKVLPPFPCPMAR